MKCASARGSSCSNPDNSAESSAIDSIRFSSERNTRSRLINLRKRAPAHSGHAEAPASAAAIVRNSTLTRFLQSKQ